MRKTICVLCAALCTITGWSQGKVKFLKTSHDFGVIKEEDSTVTYRFEFQNTGDSPVYITDIPHVCSCTDPEYSKDTIAPGKKGYVDITYIAWNRPGPIEDGEHDYKEVVVKTTGYPTTHKLRFSGYVQPKPETPADLYPEKNGKLRMASKYVYLGNVTTEKYVMKQMELYNDSDTTITLADTFDLPEFFDVKFSSKAIAPRSAVTVDVWFDPKKANEYGYAKYEGALFTDEPDSVSRKVIYPYAMIQEYFTEESKDTAVAPVAVFDVTNQSLGTVSQGAQPVATFKLKNDGKKEDLFIRKIKANNEYVTIDYPIEGIAPGEEQELRFTFNTKGRSGKHRTALTVYLNDPANPKRTLHFDVRVE